MNADAIIRLAHWNSANDTSALTFRARAEASRTAREGGGFAFSRYSGPNTPSRFMWRALVRLTYPGPEGDDHER
jgi:hypothetical protein